MKVKKIVLLALLCLTGMSAQAHEKFTYEDMRKGMFSQRGVSGVRSMKDGEHFTMTKGGKIEKYAYSDGELKAVLFDCRDHFDRDIIKDYVLSAHEDKILIVSKTATPIYRRSYKGSHYVWDIKNNRLTNVSNDGNEQVVSFSPDGRLVAFVRDNDLWLTDPVLAAFEPQRLTNDGKKNHIINGHTDWVYEEEFAFTKAYEFSPDGKKIAFLKFDESEVPEYSMTKYGQGLYPEQYVYKYPKAGDPNSKVSLWVCEYDLDGTESPKGLSFSFRKKITMINTGNQVDQYIPLIGWTPGGQLYYCRVDRLQNHCQLILVADDGSLKTIYEETNPRYIEQITRETFAFLPDGKRFIVKNESSGWMHLYLYDIKKGLINPVTKGEWEVKGIASIVDNKVYYMSNEGSVLRNNLYVTELNGKGKRRITTGEGVYSVAPSRNMKYYISTFSNTTTPRTVTLHKGNGEVVRVLEGNMALKMRLDSMKLPVKEFFTFTTERGDILNGYLIKPEHFEADGDYPVFMTQYSGPGSESVSDRWSMDWQHVLVQRGYVVACVDGRGTGGRGEEFRKCTYANLGAKEVEDQISAARWLGAQSWCDSSRIGIYGWSYGGFMSLNCILKGNDVFKMAIAVAPVTSWRFYDTIYTEIYNGLPADNPSGYDDNSPINYANMLKGRLLIMHGSGDDNVHAQNTYKMVDALIKANKKFDMMIYPDDNHSMAPTGYRHVTEKMLEYTLENL